jgi:hypothetical protein
LSDSWLWLWLLPLSLRAYRLVPALDLPTEGGGEGPPTLLGAGGKFPFIGLPGPAESGGVTS